MRSLFWKIFLWFWLTLMLVVAAFVISAALQSRPLSIRWRETLRTSLAVYAQTAVDVYERDGRDALAAHLNRVEHASRIRAFVFNEQGAEVGNYNDVSSVARGLAQRATFSIETRVSREDTKADGDTNAADDTLFEYAGLTLFAAQRVVAPSGKHYVLVGEMPRLKSTDPTIGILERLLRLLFVAITAAAVCYWLARHLTAPIIALRDAARQLAAGDLSVRVEKQLGKRQDELTELAHDFDLMAERIEASMHNQRRLLGDISHELRSPLARLNVALELAREGDAEETSRSHDRIALEAARLETLITQLLTLTRLESGAVKQNLASVDLTQLIRDIAADSDFEARHHHRAVKIATSQQCRVYGDATLLRSAIENVVRNAVCYTLKGTTVEVELRCEQAMNGEVPHAQIIVRDYGAGVPETALLKLFDSFYRVSEARDRQSGGAGLGLAITERAVRLHGGTVAARNAPEGGLIVEVSLPYHSSLAYDAGIKPQHH